MLLTPVWRVCWAIAYLEIENIIWDVVVPPLPQLRSWAIAKERTTPEGFGNSQGEISQPICYSCSISCKILIRARKRVACVHNSALISKIIFPKYLLSWGRLKTEGPILSKSREENKFVPLSDNFSQGHSGSPNGLLVEFRSIYLFYASIYWCNFPVFFSEYSESSDTQMRGKISFAIFWIHGIHKWDMIFINCSALHVFSTS